MITAERLQRLFPHPRADLVQAVVAGWGEARKVAITKPLREAHFLAQIGVETGGLTTLEENLRYTAARLMAVWPKRFPTLANAMPYALNGPKLAEKVYGGRTDLGNQGGDGWPYRGSGLIQTTGRANFRAAGFEARPDHLRQPEHAMPAACRFWADHGCNVWADADDIVGLRKTVNGGANGLDEAKRILAQAKVILAA